MMKIHNISQISNNYCSSSQFPSFKAASVKSSFFKPVIEPIKKSKDSLTDMMAYGFANIFCSKRLENIVERTKDSKKLLPSLQIFVSFILSGFYMRQTLKNKDLDTQKKKTLAINQGLCFVFPTILGWVVDRRTDKWIEKHFADKYAAVNLSLGPAKSKKLFHGIGAAKSMIVFGTMYRFLVPVFVTPIANHIGNKLNEKKALSDDKAKV